MKSAEDNEPVFIVGATCSGKSSIAIDLARNIGGELVNADAFQIYQGLDRLTAKPTAAEMEAVPHHLYGVIPIQQDCHAGRFQVMAREQIQEIKGRGKRPIIVGGSGLYIKALTHGLPPLPVADPELREQLEAIGLEELVHWLRVVDPVSANEVDQKNRRYVSRALEISLLAGVPASELRSGWAEENAKAIKGFCLQWDREELVTRISNRTRSMFQDDAVIKEVEALDRLSPPPSHTGSKAIGIREIRALLGGELSREECIERVIISTRQYAKRQTTWFKREKCFQTVCLPSIPGGSSALQQIISILTLDHQ